MDSTLYVSDLDGTLLDRNAKVPKMSEYIINDLISRGMKFTIATARSWSSACDIVKNLNLTLPVATYNGTFIVNPVNGDIIESNCFEKAQVDYIFNVLEEAGIYPLVYAFIDGCERVSWIGGRENEGVQYYLETRKGDRRLRKVSSFSDLLSGTVYYFTVIGSKEELEPLIPLFDNQGHISYNFQQELYRDEYWLEIKRFDSTKAKAVEKIKRMTGSKKIISFGDNINDLPMFNISDEAYAVSNADPRLIRAATGRIGSPEDNGVAEWLSKNVHFE